MDLRSFSIDESTLRTYDHTRYLIGLRNHVPPAIPLYPRAAVKNCQSESTA